MNCPSRMDRLPNRIRAVTRSAWWLCVILLGTVIHIPLSQAEDIAVTSIHEAGERHDAASTNELEAPPAVAEAIQQLRTGDLAGPLKNVLAIGLLSLAPAALLLTTSYIRLAIVLGLLRQALGGVTIISQQVITALTLCLTLLIMQPTWTRVYHEVFPATTQGSSEPISWQAAWQRGIVPIRDFMSRQIQLAENDEDVLLFARYASRNSSAPATYEEVPLSAILPAFILSELKTACLLGFQIYLPFLVVDLVVASVTTSVGMLMLPPSVVSLPIKLMLFVLVDGWRLVVGMLLDSFQAIL